MPRYPDQMEYSDKYRDECYEYRHVILTKEQYKKIKHMQGTIPESVWRKEFNIEISSGWVNYCRYKGEPHILLFRRALGYDQKTGIIPPETLKKIEAFEKERIEHLNQVNPDVKFDEFAKEYM